METAVHWHIGSEDGPSKRLDIPPIRAYFFWVRDGCLVDAQDYSLEELRLELGRRQDSGGETVHLFEALRSLERAQG